MKRLLFFFLIGAMCILASPAGLQGQATPTKARSANPPVKNRPIQQKKSTAAKSEKVPPIPLAPFQPVNPDTDARSSAAKKKKSVGDSTPSPNAPKSERIERASAATIETRQLADFAVQPAPVQQLIEAALDLTKLNLTYTYGSADPSTGGMDCSGTIYYLLRSRGLKDVPRDSSGQYIWARKRGQFFSVVSIEADGFEFKDLEPGDLMFWSGTYKTERTVPISHVMLYLGREKESGKRIMFGSSDGRSYNGVQRWGVSVFDFKMPRADPANPEKRVDFVGYARIPALRESLPVVAKTMAPLPPLPDQASVAVVPPLSDALREPARGSPERKAIMDALRASRSGKGSDKVIFQVNYLKVHNGWAWANITPQNQSGVPIDTRCSALLHCEDGKWKAMDPGKLPIEITKATGEKGLSRATVESLLEALPSLPSDIFPKQIE